MDAADEEVPQSKLVVVEYDPVTGIPSEFNDFLPKDTDEFKRLKASQETAAEGPPSTSAQIEAGVASLAVEEKEKKEKSSKKKKEKAKEVLVKVEQRKGKKMTTIVLGLDLFGIKPADAAKVFKKKMACGCGVSKNAENREEVEIQGSFMKEVGQVVLKEWGASSGIQEKNVFFYVNKKKVAMAEYLNSQDD